jgi:hypothetical protein
LSSTCTRTRNGARAPGQPRIWSGLSKSIRPAIGGQQPHARAEHNMRPGMLKRQPRCMADHDDMDVWRDISTSWQLGPAQHNVRTLGLAGPGERHERRGGSGIRHATSNDVRPGGSNNIVKKGALYIVKSTPRYVDPFKHSPFRHRVNRNEYC